MLFFMEMRTNALPFILRYAYTNLDGNLDQQATFKTVSEAFRHAASFNRLGSWEEESRLLARELLNPNPQVRLNALKLMAQSQRCCKEALPELTRLRNEGQDAEVRRLASDTLVMWRARQQRN